MPEWKKEIRERLAGLNLDPVRERGGSGAPLIISPGSNSALRRRGIIP